MFIFLLTIYQTWIIVIQTYIICDDSFGQRRQHNA